LSPSEQPEKCEWRITATHGERIVLNITDLDIFHSDDCRQEYIEIRDGYWIKSPLIGQSQILFRHSCANQPTQG